MTDPAIDTLQRYSGKTLTVLLALCIFHQRNGPTACAAFRWLSHASNCSPDTTTRALYRLVEDGYAENIYIHGDKHARLTVHARQLPLPILLEPRTDPQLSTIETPQKAESLSTAPTTTTDLHMPSPETDQQKETPQKAESVTVKAFADRTARILCQLGGIHYHNALEAVNHALREGDTPDDIQTQVKRWGGYLAARGLTADAGASIAANIRNGALCDDDF